MLAPGDAQKARCGPLSPNKRLHFPPRRRKINGYLSVAQAPNGVIHLFGTRMGCATFNEAWVREGKGVAEK